MPTTAPIDDYKKSAKEKFDFLKQDQSIADLGFWKLGHALDTMIDYYRADIDRSDADDVAGAVISQCDTIVNNWPADWPWTWFDDLGWWVAATTRAAQQSFFNADNSKQFGALSKQFWKVCTENAPYTYARRESGHFDQYGPFVSGGVWNSYWAGTSTDYLGYKEADPSKGKLPGIQNTVTNALYLISAQRRSDTDAAKQEYQFLSDWLFPKEQGHPPALWWPQNGGGALIRERVSALAGATPAPGFQENWAWTGDLGLMLGVFVDRIAGGNDATNALTYAKALLTGARLSLVDPNGLLKPSNDPYNTPDHDTPDYATGTGVFWCYLLRAWELNNRDLRDVLASDEYKKFVRTNADAAARPQTNTIAMNVDEATNQLAALLAGIAMLA
jgi:hypothetical protein